MALKTTRELLEEIEAAISKTLQAQEWGSGQSRVRRPDLETLLKRRGELLEALAQEGHPSPAINVGIPRRTY